MQRLNASIDFDQRLYREDIAGSVAWAEELARGGFLSGEEAAKIADGLKKIEAEVDSGKFSFSRELEDIHMNIEHRLVELLGPVGERLHTGRSRNDQVATDLRLYLKKAAERAIGGIEDLVGALARVAERELEVVIPSYTHLQRALPVLLSHHLLAYAEMFLRDRERFRWARVQADACPLGSGACAGNQFGADRSALQTRLGFARLTRNSLDAVSDRDFACDYLYASSLLVVHLSRLSDDLILWSSSEFGFVTIADEFASGSSVLPQKKNPDACELARGKCGRMVGHLVALLTVLKGLPLAYNKDLQEDKEGVFDAEDTVQLLLAVFPPLVETLSFHPDRAREALEHGYMEALGVADYLTRKGVPFREAHRLAGCAVRRAEALGVTLPALALEEYRAIHAEFDRDLYNALTVERLLEDKDVIGGTAPARVRNEIARLKRFLGGEAPTEEGKRT